MSGARRVCCHPSYSGPQLPEYVADTQDILCRQYLIQHGAAQQNMKNKNELLLAVRDGLPNLGVAWVLVFQSVSRDLDVSDGNLLRAKCC